jgi:hypothetical protein
VKCSLHGNRFKQPIFHIYVSQWLREKQWRHRLTHLLDEQISNRPCKTHSSTASATPAASYKSPYRKCPGGKQLGFPPMIRAGALVDRVLRFNANDQARSLTNSKLQLFARLTSRRKSANIIRTFQARWVRRIFIRGLNAEEACSTLRNTRSRSHFLLFYS